MPHYFRSSFAEGKINFDVLEYLIGVTSDRVTELRTSLTQSQIVAMREMITFVDDVLSGLNSGVSELLRDCEKITRALRQHK